MVDCKDHRFTTHTISCFIYQHNWDIVGTTTIEHNSVTGVCDDTTIPFSTGGPLSEKSTSVDFHTTSEPVTVLEPLGTLQEREMEVAVADSALIAGWLGSGTLVEEYIFLIVAWK